MKIILEESDLRQAAVNYLRSRKLAEHVSADDIEFSTETTEVSAVVNVNEAGESASKQSAAPASNAGRKRGPKPGSKVSAKKSKASETKETEVSSNTKESTKPSGSIFGDDVATDSSVGPDNSNVAENLTEQKEEKEAVASSSESAGSIFGDEEVASPKEPDPVKSEQTSTSIFDN